MRAVITSEAKQSAGSKWRVCFVAALLAMTTKTWAASSPTVGACQSSGTAAGACWQAELEKTQKAWDACQGDVDKFCEGIQVGEGRLKNCLKAHKAKLSCQCKAAQGLR